SPQTCWRSGLCVESVLVRCCCCFGRLGSLGAVIEDTAAVLARNQLIPFPNVAEYLRSDFDSAGDADAIIPHLGQCLSAPEPRHSVVGREQTFGHFAREMSSALNEACQKEISLFLLLVQTREDGIDIGAHAFDIGGHCG